MAATIRDIKNKTGLSLATISKYLNGGNVLPENRELIEAAIEELHYEVNEIARGLVTNKTRTIGVIVFSIQSLFNGTLLHHIGEYFRKRGYGLIICDSCNDEQTEADNVRFLISKKVDGIIVIPVSRTVGFLNPAKSRNIPVVLLDRSVEGAEYDCVRISNRDVAKEAVKHLISKNHKKIAVLFSETEYTGVERYNGFMDAMNEAGLEVPEQFCKRGFHSIEHGYNGMREILALEERPTAVFMSNYEVTLGAVMALNESKIRCPDDISLMGFDNLLLAHLVEPEICLVVQPMKEMGEKAAEMLLHRIDNKNTGATMEVILKTRIEEGNSVKEL